MDGDISRHGLTAFRFLRESGAPTALIMEYLKRVTELRYEYSSLDGGYGTELAEDIRQEIKRLNRQITEIVLTRPGHTVELARDINKSIITLTRMITEADPHGTGLIIKKLGEDILDEQTPTKV